jgi:MFS family permease
MEGWGWRLAFFIGGLLGIGSWALRRSLEESPAFLRMRVRLAQAKAVGGTERGPLAELFREHSGRIAIGIGATAIVGVFNGLLFAQMPAYLGRTLQYPAASIAAAINIAVAAMSVSLVVATWVGDMVPRRYVFRTGCVALAVGAVPAYGAIVDHGLPLPMLFLLIGLSACFTHGTFAAILADLFPTRVRFSGVAFTLNVGAVIFSGLVPLAATWLIAATGRNDAPAFLIIGAALLALVVGFWLKPFEGQIAAGDAGVPATAKD